MSRSIKTVPLPSGENVPVLGQGTWCMGEKAESRPAEVAALRLGLDLGITLLDTAEMYGDGGAEEVVAEAIAGRRDEVFIVSKVLPMNASHSGTISACERSLKRLATDRIDLYLLHWRGGFPLSQTVDALEALKYAGKIRHWGVSNFDTADMEDVLALEAGGAVEANQVLYNLTRRGIEYDLLPWSRTRAIPTMAYSPVERGALGKDTRLDALAEKHGVTRSAIALAWVLHQDAVIAIPKAVRPEHVRDNHAALDVGLDAADLAVLDRLFPPPRRKIPLEMI